MQTPGTPTMYDQAIQLMLDTYKPLITEPVKRALLQNGIDANVPDNPYQVHIGFVPVIEHKILTEIGVVTTWKQTKHQYLAVWVSVRVLIDMHNKRAQLEQILTDFFASKIARVIHGEHPNKITVDDAEDN